MAEDPPNPIDVALDLLVYVPVGLAMTAAEELPKLAAKGRARINPQITTARVVGQFAVARGRQTLIERLASRRRATAPAPPDATPEAPSEGSEPAAEPAGTWEAMSGEGLHNGAAEARPGAPSGPRPSPSAPSGPGPDDLAIPGYDSLSASQVIQRLAGLSRPELEQVRSYEEAERGRRTILNRIDQLQGE